MFANPPQPTPNASQGPDDRTQPTVGGLTERARQWVMKAFPDLASDWTTKHTSAVGSVANAAKTGFGDQPLGIQPGGDTDKTLQKWGIFGPSLIQQFNQAIIFPLATGGDAFMRAWPAAQEGIAEAARQSVLLGGGTPEAAKTAHDEVGAMVEMEIARQMGDAGVSHEWGIPTRSTQETIDFLRKNREQINAGAPARTEAHLANLKAWEGKIQSLRKAGLNEAADMAERAGPGQPKPAARPSDVVRTNEAPQRLLPPPEPPSAPVAARPEPTPPLGPAPATVEPAPAPSASTATTDAYMRLPPKIRDALDVSLSDENNSGYALNGKFYRTGEEVMRAGGDATTAPHAILFMGQVFPGKTHADALDTLIRYYQGEGRTAPTPEATARAAAPTAPPVQNVQNVRPAPIPTGPGTVIVPPTPPDSPRPPGVSERSQTAVPARDQGALAVDRGVPPVSSAALPAGVEPQPGQRPAPPQEQPPVRGQDQANVSPAQVGGGAAADVWVTPPPEHFRQPRVAKPRAERAPQTLLQFIASSGGIRDTGGEMRALGLTNQRITGVDGIVRMLVRNEGHPPDHMRLLAAEDGFLGPVSNSAMQDTYPQALWDAIDREVNGQPVYSVNDQGRVQEREDAQRQKDYAAARKAVVAMLKENGITADPGIIDHAAELVATRGIPPDDAFEQATVQAVNNEVSDENKVAAHEIAGDQDGPAPWDWNYVEPTVASQLPEARGSVRKSSADGNQPAAEAGATAGGAGVPQRREAQVAAPERPAEANAPVAERGQASDQRNAVSARGGGGEQPVPPDGGRGAAEPPAAGERAAPVEAGTGAGVLRGEVAGSAAGDNLGTRAGIERTPAQIEAGNYKKQHIKFQELPITIETAKGEVRRGVGADGKPWEVTMPADYGYIKRTEGADGEHVDVYVGPNKLSNRVFVIDQKDIATGKYDEHKVVLGTDSAAEARALYHKGFSDGRGPERLGHIRQMSVDQFKDWLRNGDTTKAIARTEATPAGDQAIIPGAEKASDATMAQRKTDQPLKPKVAQEPMDDGMFGDESKQSDLVDLTRAKPKPKDAAAGLAEPETPYTAPTFYSAVLRSVENAKITKGTPDQWAATIRNTHGVKQEELDWIGLDDWLKTRTGTLTKANIADFVRANQTEVKDVVKGEPTAADREASSQDLYEKRYDALRPYEQNIVNKTLAETAKVARHPGWQLAGGENYRELLLTLPPKTIFDPSKVKIERSLRSTTQGETILHYDGKKVGTFSDDPQLMPSGRYEQKPESHWIDVMRRRFGGDQSSGIKPMDEGANFRSGHFDEPNIIAHVRFNDRYTSADGTSYTPPQKTLFIEEIQSDWHQTGRKQGYDAPEFLVRYKTGDGHWLTDDSYPTRAEAETALKRLGTIAESTIEEQRNSRSVPDAPFKTTWPELALKRMIRWGAENGYDQIAWTPGDVQNVRYESALRQRVKSIDWEDTTSVSIKDSKDVQFGRRVDVMTTDGTQMEFELNDRGVVQHTQGQGALEALGKPIEDLVGKEIAKRILGEPSGMISGDNLMIGGEGMRGFYDRMLVNTANKLGKKFGAKVGEAQINADKSGWHITPPDQTVSGKWMVKSGDYNSKGLQFDTEAEARAALKEKIKTTAVPALPITPAMRDAVMQQGQALFEPSAAYEKAPPPPNASGHVNLGDFPAKPGIALGEQAQSYVVRRGRETGVEYLVAHDANGEVYAHGYGHAKGTGMTPRLENALRDPNKQIVVHHNHPSNFGFSAPDMAMMAMPGASSVWAHGHGGAISHGSLTSAARAAFRGLSPEEGFARVFAAADRAEAILFKAANGPVREQGLQAEGNKVHAHLVATVMQRAGIIDYRSNIDGTDFIEATGLAPYMEIAADEVRATVLGRDANYDTNAGRAPAVRHVADVGATFDRSELLARSNAGKAGDGAPRPPDDRAQEAGRQLGFAAPRGPFRPPPRTPSSAAILDRIGTEKARRFPTWNQFYEAFKDDLDPVRRARDYLVEPGRTLKAEKDPYILARLARGTYGMGAHWIDKATFRFADRSNNGQSLKEVLAPVKNDLDGFRAYAIAKRAMELNGRGIQTGVRTVMAADVVRNGDRAYGPVFRDLVAYQDRLLQYLVEAGILDPEAAAKMREANLDYVPFYRIMDDPRGGPSVGKPFNVKNPIKGIRGSGRRLVDPIESIVRNTFTFVDLAERNRVLNGFTDLAEAAGEAGKEIANRVKTPVHPIKVGEAEVKAFMRDNGIEGDPAAFTIFRPNALRPQPDMIAPFKNGKRVLYEVPEEIGAALQSLNREKAHILFRIMAVPARLLRAGATLAPEFVVRNPIRDQFTAFMLSDSGYKPFVSFLRGLGRVSLKDDAYWEWMKSGGANAALVSLDRDHIHENLMRLEHPGVRERALLIAKSPIRALRALSELTENATRVQDFALSRQRGKTPARSAYDSREVTLDFSRLGSKGAAINQIIAFWNAQTEGVDRIVRGFRAHPYRMLFRLAVSITIPSVLLWMANHDDPRWKEIPAWQRDMFWIIFTKDHIWRIPKPFELGVLFGSVPERLLDAFYDHDPHAFEGLAASIGLALTPAYLPTVAIPFIEQFANWSTFFDTPIIPRAQENVTPSQQTADYLSDTSQAISHAISQIPGVGDTSFASPFVIDNYIRGWTGGLGQYAVQIADAGLKATGIAPSPIQPSANFADMPLLRGFSVRYPSSNAASITRFYEYWQREMKREGTYQFLLKNRNIEAARTRGRGLATGIFGTGGLMGSFASALSVQRKLIHRIYDNPSISPEDKRKQIDQLYLEMIKTAQAGVKAYEKARR